MKWLDGDLMQLYTGYNKINQIQWWRQQRPTTDLQKSETAKRKDNNRTWWFVATSIQWDSKSDGLLHESTHKIGLNLQ